MKRYNLVERTKGHATREEKREVEGSKVFAYTQRKMQIKAQCQLKPQQSKKHKDKSMQ